MSTWQITTAIAGSPNSSFSMEDRHVEKNGITVGVGVTVMNKAGLTTSVKYNGKFQDGYSAHGIIGELRYEFLAMTLQTNGVSASKHVIDSETARSLADISLYADHL